MENTNKHIPLRMCTACRKMKPKVELFRLVKTADGTLCIDEGGKADGRGAYICRDEGCILTAQKRSCLERAFKSSIDRDVYQWLLERNKQI